jgi:hypothetical protein
VAIAGSAIVAVVLAPATGPDRSGVAPTDQRTAGAARSDAPSGALASSPSISEGPIGAAVTFDELRIGPLAGSDVAYLRVGGAPEVAAFPTPFDRSLWFTPSSTLCVAAPGRIAATGPVFAFDAYLGDAEGGGRLGFSASPDETGVVTSLTDFDGLDLERWYRLTVTRTVDDHVLTLTDLETGSRVIEVPLAADPTVVRARPNEACIEWSSPAGSGIFVDDVRLDG